VNLSDTQFLFPATADCAVAAKPGLREVNALAREAATHRDYLYKFAMKKVGDADLADDLVQDTLLAAIQSVDSKSAFGGRSLFRGWLTGILKHKIMDAYRDRYRFVSLTMDGDDGEHMEPTEDHPMLRARDTDTVGQAACDPQRAAELSQLLDHVDSAVAALPAGVAEVFMARQIEGESTASITERLGVTEQNIWVRVHRARKALQTRLLAVGAVDGVRVGGMSMA
jgi:RNA polymerase sigma-70 factor, ECF subfamily